MRQNLVGSLVRRCEGWAVVIAANKDVGVVCQNGRHERRSGAMQGGRSQCQVAKCLAESRKELCCLLGLLPTRYEISRNRQWRSVYQLCLRTPKILFGCSAYAEQDPWQFNEPIRSMETSHQCRFEVTVESFHKSVRLWVVRGGAV